MSIVTVLLPMPFDNGFSYKVYTSYEVGDLVKVNFGNKEMLGVICSEESDFKDESKIKDISYIYPKEYSLSKEILSFIKWVSEYNVAPLGSVLKMVLPNIKNLEKEGKPKAPDQLDFQPVELNKEQETAVEKIKTTLGQGFSTTVLEGVTGSGKTEVYLEAVKQVIENDGQVLILLPEIVLTTQLVDRFTKRFGFMPVQWHSNLTPKQKRVAWKSVKSGETKFIVGARSALFLPYSNLQFIVVDEEHDNSFKQEEGVIYHARDMAIIRSKIEQTPILLASATPSIESFYNIQQDKYNKVLLSSRYGKSQLPAIEIVDMNKDKVAKDKWISKTLRTALLDSLENKQQSILFVNRRGYAPVTLCRSCGHKVECPDCNVYMVKHKKKAILQCHHCGFSINDLTKCKSCGEEEKLLFLGPGIEKIEEEVKEFLPEARIALFTSDNITNAKQAQDLINKIINQEIDIIIGTQMITKGLHFPNLQLVGVLEVDNGMSNGDIRAFEKTYQLLNQVAGRAGRSSDLGRVFLQTDDPDNILLHYIINNKKDEFVDSELEDRNISNSPPFSRLAIVTLSSLNEAICKKYIKLTAKFFPTNDTRIHLIGPSPAPIYILRKRYRYRLIIKAERKVNLSKIIQIWIKSIQMPSTIKVKIDIDPYSFV